MQLVDASSGEPIVGARIQVDGVAQAETTDVEGNVAFLCRESSIGDVVRLYAEPRGHAPAFRSVELTASVNFQTLYAPSVSTFRTGLVDPATGGRFVFDGDLPAPVPIPFHLELEVPPGALSEAASVHVTPYPTHALSDDGIPEDAMQFGALHFALTDSAGRPAAEALAEAVTIRLRGYAAGRDLAPYDLTTLRLVRYGRATGAWTPDPAIVSADRATSTVYFRTDRLSILSVYARPKASASRRR